MPSGVADLDGLLSGLILGDNVVWVLDDSEVVRHIEDAMLGEAVRTFLWRVHLSCRPSRWQDT